MIARRDADVHIAESVSQFLDAGSQFIRDEVDLLLSGKGIGAPKLVVNVPRYEVAVERDIHALQLTIRAPSGDDSDRGGKESPESLTTHLQVIFVQATDLFRPDHFSGMNVGNAKNPYRSVF